MKNNSPQTCENQYVCSEKAECSRVNMSNSLTENFMVDSTYTF